MEYPPPIVQEESLPSQIANLAQQLFGEITKSVVDGRVVWNPACSTTTPIVINGIPRGAGEGLLCYLLRALASSGIGAGMQTLNGQPGGVTIPITDPFTNFYLLNCAPGNSLTVQLPAIAGAPYANRQIGLLALSVGAGITIQRVGGDTIFAQNALLNSISFLVNGESYVLTAGNVSGGNGTWYQF